MSTDTIIPAAHDAFAPMRDRLRDLTAPMTDAELARVVRVPAGEDVRNFDAWPVTNTLLLMHHLGLSTAEMFGELKPTT